MYKLSDKSLYIYIYYACMRITERTNERTNMHAWPTLLQGTMGSSPPPEAEHKAEHIYIAEIYAARLI